MLAAGFIICIHYSLTAFSLNQSNRKKLDAMTVRLKLMNDQRLETEKMQENIKQAKKFMEKAKALGLEKNQWVNYEVNIHEPVSFSEMETIVNQCTNTPTYYFKPILLEVKTDVESFKKEIPEQGATLLDDKKVDVVLLLKGHFIARNK